LYKFKLNEMKDVLIECATLGKIKI
jgi:hypothetical protein